MVGQTAEGLGADDVGGAGVDELQHLGGEEPALSHLIAVPQIALDHSVQVLEGARCTEAAGALQRLDHVLLTGLDVLHKELAGSLLDPLAAVQIHVHYPVVDLEDHEIGEAGDHGFGPLGEQKVLQIIVAQGGELYIDLTHDAHPHLLLPGDGDGGKVGADGVKVGPHLAAAHPLTLLEALDQPALPGGDHGVSGAPLPLIGPDLVGHIDDDVPVHHGVDHLADDGESEGEAGIFLQTGQIHRDHRHKGKVRFFQRLAQQVDVVGGPAAAPGLGDEQGHLVGVIAAVLDGVDQLSDDQQGGVAGVVVDIFEPFIDDAPVVGGEHIHLVALQLQQTLEHPEVDGQHLGHEDGVLLLHLLGKEETAGVVIY